MFSRKKDSKEIAAKNETKRAKNKMDEFKDKVSVPLHLSLPFYIISVFILLIGVFIIVHWAAGTHLIPPEGSVRVAGKGGAFFTTARKTFGLQGSMNDVRWRYYVPMGVFEDSLLNGLYCMLLGIVFIFLNKTGIRAYAKKRVRELLEEKGR